jgi:hypothetical protein
MCCGCPKLDDHPHVIGWRKCATARYSLVHRKRRSISSKKSPPSHLHHTTLSPKILYAPSGHGLTWPVSSSSHSLRFFCILREPVWSWHFLHLWSRSPIPFDITSLPSPVSLKSSSVHFVRILSPSFHVYNTSIAQHPAYIASTDLPRLASTLDLFHQDSISILSESILQDLPHRL